jgi:hypothetical protein
MVAMLRPGLPVRLLRGDRGNDRVPREDLVERERALDRREPHLVAEGPAHGDVGLAVRRELGPVAGDRRVEIEEPTLDEPEDARRRDALRRRKDERERVLHPRPPGGAIGEPAPEIHDEPPAMVDRACRAHVAVAGEVLGERVAHFRETWLEGAVDLDRHAGLL